MCCLDDNSFKAMIIQVLNKDGRSHLVAIVKGKRSTRSSELLPDVFQSQKQNIEKTC
jgi:hypothetical protein